MLKRLREAFFGYGKEPKDSETQPKATEEGMVETPEATTQMLICTTTGRLDSSQREKLEAAMEALRGRGYSIGTGHGLDKLNDPDLENERIELARKLTGQTDLDSENTDVRIIREGSDYSAGGITYVIQVERLNLPQEDDQPTDQ